MERETHEFKVVIAGPFGVGKTTMIKHISSVPVVGTEVPTRGDEAAAKASTTVGMEHGLLETSADGFDLSLMLYGTPGQERFRFMWEIVAVGADACVVLVDALDSSTWDEAASLIRFFRDEQGLPLVIGANRGLDAPIEVCELAFRLQAGSTPVIACNAVDEGSSKKLVVRALEQALGRENGANATEQAVSHVG